jgi:hypothetical protein
MLFLFFHVYLKVIFMVKVFLARRDAEVGEGKVKN